MFTCSPLSPSQKSNNAADAQREVRVCPSCANAAIALARPHATRGARLCFGSVSGANRAMRMPATSAVEAASAKTSRGPLSFERTPPDTPPTMKAAPTAIPCSKPSFCTSCSGGVMSLMADWHIGSMHEVTPSTARPSSSVGSERESATVPQPAVTPKQASSCSGLRPTWSETAPHKGSNRKVISWSTDWNVPISVTPAAETLVELSALANELQSAGIAGAVSATDKK
mmetsp:Transcript_29572/g.74346  ORF Transcript_29572/g.74346 Transcript_29572/m.74346 type:complete len:228 (-) Transcript_29572:385-1068(-)